MRKLAYRGARFEQSFDGDTTFAPLFTFSVAGNHRLVKPAEQLNRARQRFTVDADVHASPINEYKTIATGKPNAWPITCDF